MSIRRLAHPLIILLAAFTTSLHGQGKTVQATLTPPETRSLAPDFSLRDARGQDVRLSAFRGHVVLLDFWATKCGGCIEEIPMFIDVDATYHPHGFRTLGVSEDIIYENLSGAVEAWREVNRFVADHRVDYGVVVDDREVHRRYNITALPLTYLIDKSGRIAACYTGVVDRANLEANIRSLLGEGQ